MKSRFKRSFLLSSGIIIVAFAIFVFGFHYLGGKLATESAAITTDRATISHSSGAAERLADLKNSQSAAEGYRRLISLLLPSQEELLNLPREIEGVGRLHQVGALFTFSASGDAVAPGTTVLPFSITATGNGQNLIDFLKEIEVNHPKYTITIDSVDITGGDPTSQQLLATGRVFFQPQP